MKNFNEIHITRKGLYEWLKRMPVYFLVPCLLLLRYAVWGLLLLYNIVDMPDGTAATSLWDDDPLVVRLLIMDVLMPLVETLLFQLLPIEIILWIGRKLKNRSWAGQNFELTMRLAAVFGTSIVFAMQHMYDFPYFIHALIGGLAYALCYLVCRDKRNVKYAFLATAAMHILHNLLVDII